MISLALLLNFSFKILSIYLLLPLNWSVHDIPFPYFWLFAWSNSRKLELFSIFLEGSSKRESTYFIL